MGGGICAAFPCGFTAVHAQSKKRHDLDMCNRTTSCISHGKNKFVMFPAIVLNNEIGRGKLLLAKINIITSDRPSCPAYM